jgi:hypothetical protein
VARVRVVGTRGHEFVSGHDDDDNQNNYDVDTEDHDDNHPEDDDHRLQAGLRIRRQEPLSLRSVRTEQEALGVMPTDGRPREGPPAHPGPLRARESHPGDGGDADPQELEREIWQLAGERDLVERHDALAATRHTWSIRAPCWPWLRGSPAFATRLEHGESASADHQRDREAAR